jgi:isoleucyl-tRNA synthetase
MLFEDYKLNEVPSAIEELFLELSRTYMQLVRDKSSVGSDEDKKVVVYAIYNVLFGTLKMFAPIAPFVTEAIYSNLRKEFKLEEDSIHLWGWPEPDEKAIDNKLEKEMGIISSVVQAALSAREKINLGVRWPLPEIIFVTKDKATVEAIEKLGSIIKTQVNVKEIRVQESLPGIKTRVRADFAKIGPDFGGLAPKIIAKIAVESPETLLGHLEKEGKFEVDIEGNKLNIVKEHLIVEREVPSEFQEASFKGGFLYLNKEMDEELEAEGYSREVMRRVQNLRKKSGLQKSDSISLFIKAGEDFVNMLLKHEDAIKEKVGAGKLKISTENPAKKHAFSGKEKVKGKEFEIFFSKV